MVNGDGGSGSPITILLVEDEPPLLQLIQKYLQRMGFEVETHLKSVEALRDFEAAPDRYGMVIADLGMPEMRGDTLLTRMLEIRPDLRILVCSGSPFFIETLPNALQRQVAFLQKPFVPKMLAEAVQNLLKERPRNPSTTSR
jgi:DNA-binding NtrC family response regulator